jgi:oligopeptide transport system substrate-binding protein
VPQKTWLALGDAHNYGMMIGLWGADYPDSSNFLNRWTSTTADFAGAWNNKEYDKLIADAAGKDVLSKTKRWNDLQKATKLITKDMGVIPIYQWGSAHLTKTSIKGMQYVPNSQYQYIGATNKK